MHHGSPGSSSSTALRHRAPGGVTGGGGVTGAAAAGSRGGGLTGGGATGGDGRTVVRPLDLDLAREDAVPFHGTSASTSWPAARAKNVAAPMRTSSSSNSVARRRSILVPRIFNRGDQLFGATAQLHFVLGVFALQLRRDDRPLPAGSRSPTTSTQSPMRRSATLKKWSSLSWSSRRVDWFTTIVTPSAVNVPASASMASTLP